MSDLFVSYSRKDSTFVRQLHDALDERGKEVWVDWQDIPPTAEWIDEIRDAIEKAESFAFVISPHSLSSDICRVELEHAQKHNKRIVPLALDTEGQIELPDVLQRLNWIVFSAGEGIDEPVDKLVAAIETDLDWVRAHTRLTTRAVEWEHEGERAAYLLGGEDLDRAESQLEQGLDKDPRPTALQTRYVGTSRRSATGRQRRILGATAGALLLSIALGGAAVVQRNRAQAAALRAEAQKLIAIGQLDLETFPTSTLAYATKSLELSDTEEGRLLALRALRQGPPARRLHGLEKALSAKFSPGGEYLVYTAWVEEPGSPVVRLVRSDGSWQVIEAFDVGRTAFAYWQTDDLFLTLNAVHEEGSHWTLYSASEARALGEALTPRETQFAQWDPERRRLVAFTNSGEVLVTGMKPGEEARSLGKLPFNHNGLARGGRWIATRIDGDMCLVEILEDSLAEPSVLGRHKGATELLVSNEAGLAVSRDPSGEIRVWDASGSSPPRSVEGPPGGGGRGSSLDPSGSLYYISIETGSGGTENWVLSIPEMLLRQLVQEPGIDPVFDPQKRHLALIAAKDDIRLQRLYAPDGVHSIKLQIGIKEEVKDPSFHPSGNWFASTYGLTIFDISRPYPIRLDRGSSSVVFDPLGRGLLASLRGNPASVGFWPLEGDVLPASRTLFTKPDGGYFTVLAVSPDGDRVLAGKGRAYDDAGPVLFSFEDGSTQFLEDGFSDQIMGCAFSPDGRYAAASGGQMDPEERFIKVWDLETLEIVATHAPEERLSHTVAGFTHDNRALWSSTEGLFAWNLATGEHEKLVEGYANLHTSADGTVLLVAQRAGGTASLANLTIIDLETGGRTPMTTHGSVHKHTLDPAGRTLASITRDGILRVGPVSGEEPHVFETSITTARELAIDPLGRWVAVASPEEISLWPLPPAGDPPLHTLPHDVLIDKLRSLTNARLVEDPESSSGWKLGWDTFPGWDVVPGG